MDKSSKESNVRRLPLTGRLTPASAPLPNPFRPRSMKAACFERFLRGGDSKTLVADFRALGAAGTTANTWLSVFRTFVRGMRAAKKEGGAE